MSGPSSKLLYRPAAVSFICHTQTVVRTGHPDQPLTTGLCSVSTVPPSKGLLMKLTRHLTNAARVPRTAVCLPGLAAVLSTTQVEDR